MRRHTRCALVTGVQTCALPISGQYEPSRLPCVDVAPAWSRAAATASRSQRICDRCLHGMHNAGTAIPSMPADTEQGMSGKQRELEFRFRAEHTDVKYGGKGQGGGGMQWNEERKGVVEGKGGVVRGDS